MKMIPLKCPYCGKPFFPSPFRPQQRVCPDASCQRQRRRDYHRAQLKADAEYREVCRDSRKKWRECHPDYQREYRDRHPDYVERNRAQQRRRDQKRRLECLVKNNVALKVKPVSGEVWLVGQDLAGLLRNTFVVRASESLSPCSFMA